MDESSPNVAPRDPNGPLRTLAAQTFGDELKCAPNAVFTAANHSVTVPRMEETAKSRGRK